MASSNRHWPSMFKSKPCSNHQWQQDINSNSLIPNANDCEKKTPCSSGGSDERSPEPKARWNPRPEQIRILEAVFNSGMVNPPRDEIRKIRAQLQEFGHVGDANVFYWFQNRKSRSKHKQQRLLLLQNSSTKTTKPPGPVPPMISSSTLTSSSRSSSSEKSPEQQFLISSLIPSNSPTSSVNQLNLAPQNEILTTGPFSFPMQGFGFTDHLTNVLSNDHHVVDVLDNSIGSCSSFLLGDFLLDQSSTSKKAVADEKMKLQHPNTPSATQTTATVTHDDLSFLNHYQGDVCETGPTKSTVFINDVAFEVTMSAFNVREAFGDDALLLHSSGQPVLTNEWGVTLHPLQNGGFYYLIRTLIN